MVSEKKKKQGLSQSKARSAILFFQSARKTQIWKGRWDLASCQVSLNSIQQFQRRSWKYLSQSEAWQPSCFLIGPKNTNSVEDVEILLPINFHWIPFSGFREVKNVSANQRPGRPSCFSKCPKNTNLEGTLRSCFLSSFVEFFSAISDKWKTWKVNDGGQHKITLVHLSLQLRCTKKGSMSELHKGTFQVDLGNFGTVDVNHCVSNSVIQLTFHVNLAHNESRNSYEFI